MTTIELRDYQQGAIDSLKASIANGHKRPVLQLPTGAGKTVIAAHVVKGAQGKGNRVCFVVPSIGLIDQTFDRFVENGIDPSDMGVIQASHPWRRPSAPVQIATAQTLARRELPKTDVVVVDEAHVGHKVIADWMADPNGVKIFIGLTATPWAKGMGKKFDDLIKPVSLTGLIDLKRLSPFRVFAPTHPDLRGVKTVRGDFDEAELADRMNQPALTGDVVGTWLRMASDRPTLCFATGRNHAIALHDEFAKAGVAVAYVDAHTPRQERERIGAELAAGRVKVVCNIGCLTTGIDWDVRCISLVRPTKSDMLFCLDSETEILTSHGWKGIGQVREGDCAATADIDNGHGAWSMVVATVERDMHPDERWVEYDAPRANFRVTDNHNMLFKSDREEEGYRVAPAREMLDVKGSVYVPTAVQIAQPGVPLTGAELYFIGMMMTDGTWTSTAGSICQSERYPEIIERIEDCLRDCGIAYSKSREVWLPTGSYAERYPRWRYSISAGKPKPHGNQGRGPLPTKRAWKVVDGVTGYGHLLPYLDKDFAPALMALSKTQFEILLRGLFDGDGSKKEGKPWCDYTPQSIEICSARQVCMDRLQALAAIHGMTANLRLEATGRVNPIWVLTITPKDWRSIGGYSSKGRDERPQVRLEPATNERVWCVETEAGTIVTRRRGKVTVMGNCQIIGRGLRTAAGKADCLILDHSDTHLRLGMVTDIDYDHLDDGKPQSASAKAKADERKAPLPKCCSHCHALVAATKDTCQECGTVIPRGFRPTYADGELIEFGRPATKQTVESDPLRSQGKQAVWSQILGVAKDRNRSRGWASHTYKDIFGVWPARLADFPMEATGPVIGFVRHKDIRFAKSRQMGGEAANA